VLRGAIFAMLPLKINWTCSVLLRAWFGFSWFPSQRWRALIAFVP
jgi:hypothetical protein